MSFKVDEVHPHNKYLLKEYLKLSEKIEDLRMKVTLSTNDSDRGKYIKYLTNNTKKMLELERNIRNSWVYIDGSIPSNQQIPFDGDDPDSENDLEDYEWQD